MRNSVMAKFLATIFLLSPLNTLFACEGSEINGYIISACKEGNRIVIQIAGQNIGEMEHVTGQNDYYRLKIQADPDFLSSLNIGTVRDNSIRLQVNSRGPYKDTQ